MLLALSGLYRQLLELLRDVARVQPMPFLTDFSLPADLAQFLGPSDALLLTKPAAHSRARQEKKQAAKKLPAEAKKTCTQKRKLKEDLGVAVIRGSLHSCAVFPNANVTSVRREPPHIPTHIPTHIPDISPGVGLAADRKSFFKLCRTFTEVCEQARDSSLLLLFLMFTYLLLLLATRGQVDAQTNEQS